MIGGEAREAGGGDPVARSRPMRSGCEAQPRSSATPSSPTSGRRSSRARRPSWSARPETRSTARSASRIRPRAELAAYPDDLRELVEGYLAELRFSDRAATAGLDEAMRCSLLAKPASWIDILCLAAARAALADPAAVLPGSGRDRAHPHLLADPRRPARDGRRRAAARTATSHVVYGEDVAILAGDGLFAEAIGTSAIARRVIRRGSWRRSPSSPERPGWGGWSGPVPRRDRQQLDPAQLRGTR